MPSADSVDQITDKLANSATETGAIEDEKCSIGHFGAQLTAEEVVAVGEQSDVYDFDSFIQRMRHASCKPILENIKR